MKKLLLVVFFAFLLNSCSSFNGLHSKIGKKHINFKEKHFDKKYGLYDEGFYIVFK